ncbi:helix-turn-helix transcriptional regulator [Paremcibacter congregatus]|uniref:helix-turn-helix transcriptional regulator n=1 Tax=Paremcibacter congregatus TaxID=2043170 RepID=UPI0030ECE501|tara:strand:- start:735 stop:959 length:225 start_codon:yes stop_codon:yes gene_type:complete
MAEPKIFNNIKILRFEAGGISQAELAKRVGVTRQTILALEAHKYSPSLELAFKIAAAFDVSLNEVFQYGVLEDD